MADLRQQVLLARPLECLVDGRELGAGLRAHGLLAGLLHDGGLGVGLGRLRAGLLGLLGGLQDRLTFTLGALAGKFSQRRARGARQRDGLEHRQAVGHGVRAEDADR